MSPDSIYIECPANQATQSRLRGCRGSGYGGMGRNVMGLGSLPGPGPTCQAWGAGFQPCCAKHGATRQEGGHTDQEVGDKPQRGGGRRWGGSRKGHEIPQEAQPPPSDLRRNGASAFNTSIIWGHRDYLSLYSHGPKSGDKGHIKSRPRLC